jgi:hypothetical protein
MNVIFRDEYGNELQRQVTQFTLWSTTDHHISFSVGDFTGSENDSDQYDEAPVELTDERGRLVYKRVGCDYLSRGKSLTDMMVVA